MIDLMKVKGTDGKEYRVPVAAVDAIVARNRRHTDAAPGEAALGRELIAWAAEPANVYACEAYTVKFCVFCESLTGHTDDCLHLRARALRGDNAG